MLFFTDRQNKIIDALSTNRFMRNRQLAEQLGVTESTISNDLAAIIQTLGVSIRQAIPAAAKKAGWPYVAPITRYEESLATVAQLIPEMQGPLRDVLLAAEATGSFLGDLRQVLWSLAELEATPAEQLAKVNDIARLAYQTQAGLSALIMVIHEKQKEAGKTK
jgi:DNA-binding CsgD family transcriptional regulator